MRECGEVEFGVDDVMPVLEGEEIVTDELDVIDRAEALRHLLINVGKMRKVAKLVPFAQTSFIGARQLNAMALGQFEQGHGLDRALEMNV
ncbi:hypothetical protein Amn_45190 [Aminobacter sp. Y103A]|nr:hypothetical protein Amn_45190 [Aminobacter sp. SS-2016]